MSEPLLTPHPIMALIDHRLYEAQRNALMIMESAAGANLITENSHLVDYELYFDGLATLARDVYHYCTDLKAAVEAHQIVCDVSAGGAK